MKNSNYKAIVIAVLLVMTAAFIGGLAEEFFGWSAERLTISLLGGALYWILDDLYEAREGRR